MEYLHSVEILVKRLSDSTVILESTDGTITPYLTNLESARLFKERTTGGKYDIRYEMPKKQHNIYTDIWSWENSSGNERLELLLFSSLTRSWTEQIRMRQLSVSGRRRVMSFGPTKTRIPIH